MSQSIVTRERVYAIADRLEKEGIRPTNRLILHQLGGGSMTPIAMYLREWNESKSQAAENNLPEMPSSVTDSAMTLMAILWKESAQAARANMKSLTEDLNQKLMKIEGERDNLLNELSEAETELGASLKEGETLKKQLLQLRNELAQVNEANIHLKGDVEKAIAVRQQVEVRAAFLQQELAKAQDQVESLRRQLTEEQAMLQIEKEQHAELRGRFQLKR